MIVFLLAFLTCASSLQANDTLYINQKLTSSSISEERKADIEKLSVLLSDEVSEPSECSHVIKQILEAGKYILLEDESLWLVGWNYRGTVQNWRPKDRLKISYHNQYSNNIQFENVGKGECAWGVNQENPQITLSPFIIRLSNSVFDPDEESKLILNDGSIFKGPRVAWKVREAIFIFHSSSPGYYDLWNLARNERIGQWRLVGNEKQGSPESILNIEQRLSERVLGQQDVIQNISTTLFNCWAGLNDPQIPVGVFLFLGPTGVGKTELAKALTQELYKNQNRLIRFDMSQFPTQHDYTRLIGSPPGYVNHEEGGQLTEAIKGQPQSIVLLDEMEKAHPSIRKAFLPIFDEGYISDSKNNKIMCNRVVFIMTGNICSDEIALLFNKGYSAEEILKMIEPTVIATLSPEFYNRVTTVVFRPITFEVMESLVNQKLNEVIERLKCLKAIDLVIEDTARSYLITYGFHPTLGARPLKRLIQSKVVASLSYVIINEGIPDGSKITLFYSQQDDSWNINWSTCLHTP